MLVLLAAFVTLGIGTAGSPRPQTPDSMALGVALAHARTAIPEGTIQVSPDPVPYRVVRRTDESRLRSRHCLNGRRE